MKNKEVIMNELSFKWYIWYCELKRIFPLKRLINLLPFEIYSTFESMYMYVYNNYDKQLNRKKIYTMVGQIFVWNDTFQVDNESECFLEREW